MAYPLRSLAFLLVGALPALASDVPGITNFDRVDTHVYRGGQPSDEGFHYLAGLGVKTIIDLREAGGRSQAEERTVKAAGMAYLNVPMSGLTPPTDAEILKILPILENSSSGAVFVHCLHGKDRTGAVIAAYHIAHDHWDNAHALNDAKTHHMSMFQLPRQSFIRNFHPLTLAAQNDSSAAVAAPAARQ